MRRRGFITTSVAALLALPGVAALAQEGPPPALPLEPVTFPDFAQHTLSNGAEVIVVHNDEQPVVTVNLRVKSGSAHDPKGKEGLAGATADLLNKGTTTRDSKEIAEAIDFLGASLSANAGADWSSITSTALTEFLDDALEIMSDIVVNPTFPEDELEIERKRTLSALKLELSQPQAVAERHFIKGIYGDHPYSSLPTVESVEAMQSSDLAAFHSAHYQPGNALFVVAGDISESDAIAKLERHFGKWLRGTTPGLGMTEPPVRSDRDILFYHKPGSVQAVVRLGHLMKPATDPDWPSIDVMLRVLGSSSTSWLFQVLREEKGYTYGAYARSTKRIDRSYFQARAEVRNEVTDSAMADLIGLIERIREEEVPQKDLDLAVNAITGSFPRRIETPQQVAGQVATNSLRGLPKEYLDKYRERVAAVDAAEVQRVARKHLDPDRALIVVVGDASQIYDQVAKFGNVQLFDVEGAPLALADLAVKAAAFTFDPSGIEPMTLVYNLNFQGNPIGEAVTEVTREARDGREVVRSHETATGMGFSTEQDVIFDAVTFQGIESNASQSAGPNNINVELALNGDVLKGKVSGAAPEPTEIDTQVPAGMLLPGMDAYAIMLADFEANEVIELPAFNALSGTTYTLKLKRVGESTITVPVGEFEVYEIEASGGEAAVTVFVRKEAPHILIKQEFAAQPIALELKEIR